MFQAEDELPYFDATGNQYAQELRRQDAYIGKGGKLSAPQMIKYENRVAMLVERLLLVLEALKGDDEAIKDYLAHIEFAQRKQYLPRQVYQRFMERIHESAKEDPSVASERDRDRLRVIQGGQKVDSFNFETHTEEVLIEMYRKKTISSNTLFTEFHKRERSGKKLPKMDSNIWGHYRSWVAQKRRSRRQPRNHDK